jgi:3-Oxoacyl-[acyl-carrier-protein (ACP)] synthase III
MSRIFVAGLGAVSPAGWTVAAMRDALDSGKPLPAQPLEPQREKPLLAHMVPNPAVRPEFLAHPRLRRASAITHYAASAALEASATLRQICPEATRFGLILCFHSGCVQYSGRFYDEALKNPATASPLLFPETVYAAPASHIAALLKNVTLVNSFVGDPSSFLQGVSTAAQWLEENRVEACLVIGAEEINWITADALWHLDRAANISGGAGALCLCRDPKWSVGVELTAITDAHPYTAKKNRAQAARAMRDQLIGNVRDGNSDLLCDGIGNGLRSNAPEVSAWRAWSGLRISPKRILGEGLMAAAAWQCVAACDAVANGRTKSSNVSLVGFNQQAIGAKFMGVSDLSAGKI